MKVWQSETEDTTLIETAWEREMNLAGIDAFERSKYTETGGVREASTSRTGQKLLRKFLDQSAKAIAKMQKQVLGITSRTPRSLRATILMVPEDTAALLTLRALMDRTYGLAEPDKGYVFQILCKEVSKAVELELNFRHWLKESKTAAEAYAKQQGWDRIPMSLAERLIEERGVSRSQILKWKRTFDELNTYQWDELEYHYCGEALIQTVVDELSDVFEIHLVSLRGKTVKHVRMKPEFIERFDEMEMKVANMQVVRKPMIARPNKWSKVTLD